MNDERGRTSGSRLDLTQLLFLGCCCMMALAVLVASGCAEMAPFVPGTGAASQGTVMNEPIIGFATDIQPGHITLKDMQGTVYDVVPASNLKIFGKDGKPATLADLHVGDGFAAQGFLSGTTIRALQAKITDPAIQQRLFGRASAGTGGAGGTTGAGASNRPFAMGTVTSIDQQTISVQGSDGSVRVVTVDSNTAFYRVSRSAGEMPSAAHPHGKPVSRADLKVGDMVSVTGNQQGNQQGNQRGDVFAATSLTIMKLYP